MRKFLLVLVATMCCVTMFPAQFNGLKTVLSGGQNRQYYLYVPDGLTANRPLIISCHGMEQDYKYQKEQTQWPSMADTANFVVAYPVGISGTVWGVNYTTGWDVESMTDVNFMLDIVAAVKADYNIDATRVYMSGFSQGGAFVYHVANKAADKFAAFAPISGYNIMTTNTSTSRAVPIIHVHGTADNVMPYSGVKDYIKKWAQAQNCDATPEETTGDGVSRIHYKNGTCETEVMLYSVNGREHEPTNQTFHTSNAIWSFCRQYTTNCGKIKFTDITEQTLNRQSSNRKIIKDGQLLIEKNDKTYNAQGTEIKK